MQPLYLNIRGVVEIRFPALPVRRKGCPWGLFRTLSASTWGLYHSVGGEFSHSKMAFIELVVPVLREQEKMRLV